jgi:hypothetical protein
MRLFLKESRIKALNATKLDRKIRGKPHGGFYPSLRQAFNTPE